MASGHQPMGRGPPREGGEGPQGHVKEAARFFQRPWELKEPSSTPCYTASAMFVCHSVLFVFVLLLVLVLVLVLV